MKVQIIIWSLIGVLIGGLIMWVYHEYKYDLLFSNDLCQKVGFKSYSGIGYFMYENRSIGIDGIVCKRKDGVHSLVRQINPDGSHR